MIKKIKSKLIFKQNEEKEQYSTSKTLILLKPSLKSIRKRNCSKFTKVKLEKPKCHMLKIISKNFKEKYRKILVQTKNFQFDKVKASKTIDLERMLKRNVLECGEYKHRKIYLKHQFAIY